MGTELERALWVRDLRRLPAELDPYDRLYFGTDLCDRRTPTADEVTDFSELARARDLPWTLVTPWCTDEGLGRIESLLDLLAPGQEVVFNDWGVRELLRDSAATPVMGRQLVRIWRDPFVESGSRFRSERMRSNLDSSAFLSFLRGEGISRVELDNVLQGYSFDPPPWLSTSLGVPFVLIASGRKCVFTAIEGAGANARVRPGPCAHQCVDQSFEASLERTDARILVCGGSHLYRNDVIPGDLARTATNRVVVSPVIPL